MKTKLLYISLAAFLLILSPLISANFPIGHDFTIFEALKKDHPNSDFYKACKNNPGICYASGMLPDITVYDYYTLFIRYRQTHIPTLCRDLLEKAVGEVELACAVSGCLHQHIDLESHTDMIPYAISKTFLPNVVIHPFTEQKLDLYITSNNPNINFDKLKTRADFEACVPLYVEVMIGGDGTFQGLKKSELEKRFDGFITELTGQAGATGYDLSFRRLTLLPTGALVIYFGVMFFFGIITVLLYMKRLRYKERRNLLNFITFGISLIVFLFMGYLTYQYTQGNAFSTFQAYLAKPLSKFVPMQDPQSHVDDAVKGIDDFFERGIVSLSNPVGKGSTDASGQAALNAADASIKKVQYIIMFVVGLLIMFILWKNFQEVRPKGMTLGGL